MAIHKERYFHRLSQAKICGGNRKSLWGSMLLMLSLPLLGIITSILLPGPESPVYASSHKGQETGASLFHEKGCEYCHGVNGVGTDKAPDLTNIGTTWKKSQIKRQILNGGHEMPPFRNALQSGQVEILVYYLSSKTRD